MIDPAAFIRANTEIATPPLVPEVRLHLATEVTPLWHATETTLEREGLPPPYWAFAWPGGQALARLILDQPDLVRDKRVLDFGAGCGAAAIAAMKAGASEVVAAEIDPFALAALALNAALNDVVLSIEGRDFLAINPDFPDRSGTENAILPTGFDVILVGDMCYERPLAEKLVAFLERAASNGTNILLADPGRAYLPKERLEPVARFAIPTSLDLEDRTMRETEVYRFATSAR